MGRLCDQRPNSVLESLEQVFAWRSTVCAEDCMVKGRDVESKIDMLDFATSALKNVKHSVILTPQIGGCIKEKQKEKNRGNWVRQTIQSHYATTVEMCGESVVEQWINGHYAMGGFQKFCFFWAEEECCVPSEEN